MVLFRTAAVVIIITITIITTTIKRKSMQTIICIQTLVENSHSKIGYEIACEYVCAEKAREKRVFGGKEA